MRLLVGSRVLKRRRVRRALLARLARERDEPDDEAEESDEEIGAEGGDRERKFLRLLLGSRMLRRRRVRRAILAHLLKQRGETDDEYDEGEEGDDEEGPDLERQLARLLIGGRAVRRRRGRRALARSMHNGDD
jgi:hypothetical protein